MDWRWLRYGAQYAFTAPNTNLAAERQFALNGLNVIDVSGTAGQPFQWTAISAAYNRYLVDRVTVVAEFYDTSADGLFVGAQVRGPSTSGASAQTLELREGNWTRTISNTGEQKSVLTMDLELHKVYGLTKAQYLADFTTIMGTNPGGTSTGTNDLTAYLRIFAVSGVAGAITTFNLKISFLFHVQLSDLIQ
jgi:hypothetical protein